MLSRRGILIGLAFLLPTVLVAGGEETPTLMVFNYDGSRQCEPGSGTALDVMANQLTRAGVRVISARKGNDGRMHPMVCGGNTGVINIFEIKEQDIETARSLGFKDFQTH